MSDFVIEPPHQPYVPVAGGGRFPVRRIYCVGRNYAEHAREMGHDPDKVVPVFFAKPADALVIDSRAIPYPPETIDLHHEIELVAAIGQGGADIAVDNALDYVWGYAAGIDLTRRDLQGAAKKNGQPWELGKSFDNSAPIGTLAPSHIVGHPGAGSIALSVNGTVRQSADIADMIWDLPHIIAHLSRYFELQPGDLIFTGTPAGVGAVTRGDQLMGEIAGVGTVSVTIL